MAQGNLIVPHDAQWTVRDLADYLQVSPKTVRHWIYKDRVPLYRIGGQIRFSKLEIDQWISNSKP